MAAGRLITTTWITAGDPHRLFTAEPHSKSAEALSLLGSWAATPEQVSAVPIEEQA
jgi:hypothetical protein